jgi:hypothetical protein
LDAARCAAFCLVIHLDIESVRHLTDRGRALSNASHAQCETAQRATDTNARSLIRLRASNMWERWRV